MQRWPKVTSELETRNFQEGSILPSRMRIDKKARKGEKHKSVMASSDTQWHLCKPEGVINSSEDAKQWSREDREVNRHTHTTQLLLPDRLSSWLCSKQQSVWCTMIMLIRLAGWNITNTNNMCQHAPCCVLRSYAFWIADSRVVSKLSSSSRAAWGSVESMSSSACASWKQNKHKKTQRNKAKKHQQETGRQVPTVVSQSTHPLNIWQESKRSESGGYQTTSVSTHDMGNEQRTRIARDSHLIRKHYGLKEAESHLNSKETTHTGQYKTPNVTPIS